MRADWEKFKILCEERLKLIKVNEEMGIEKMYTKVVSAIRNGASECIPKSTGKRVEFFFPVE